MTLVRAAQGVVDARAVGTDLDPPIDALAAALRSHRAGGARRVAKRRGGDVCGVVDSDYCDAPANSDALTTSLCYACGQPVCSGCSTRVDWYTYGRQRIGFDCLRERDMEDVVERVYERRRRKEARRG